MPDQNISTVLHKDGPKKNLNLVLITQKSDEVMKI